MKVGEKEESRMPKGLDVADHRESRFRRKYNFCLGQAIVRCLEMPSKSAGRQLCE